MKLFPFSQSPTPPTAAARFFLRSLFLAAVFSALTGWAQARPPSLTLHFDFFYNGIHAAQAEDVFFADSEGGYKIESHARAVGLAKILYGDFRRKSEGVVGEGGELHFRRYEQQRGQRPPQVAEVSGDALLLQKGDESRRETLPDGALLDYLTAQYRAYALGKLSPMSAATTNGWRLKVYNYDVGEEETVATPLGEMRATPLRRESSRGMRVFWLAESLGWLPVKSVVEDKGHRFETVLVSITAPPNFAK